MVKKTTMFGISIMVIGLVMVVGMFYVLPLTKPPVQGDPNTLNSVTCTVAVKNDVPLLCTPLGGNCASITSYQCQFISQCAIASTFGTPPSTGTHILMAGKSTSIVYQNDFSPRTDQLTLCIPSTATTGVIKLYKDGQERDSKSFTVTV